MRLTSSDCVSVIHLVSVLLNASHGATNWNSGGGTSKGDTRVKKAQFLLSRIPESLKTDFTEF